ncbi:MAG: hypothetical protein ACRER2_10580 [Methylococcales bacterium]
MLSIFGVKEAIALPISHLFYGIVTYIHNLLETQEIKPTMSILPNSIVTLKDFWFGWYLTVVYGTLIFFAMGNLGIILGSIVASTLSPGGIAIIIQIVGAFVSSLVIFFTGHWIGLRCDKNGTVTITAVAFFGSLLGMVADLLVATELEYCQVRVFAALCHGAFASLIDARL